jgi:hypothetical protein
LRIVLRPVPIAIATPLATNPKTRTATMSSMIVTPLCPPAAGGRVIETDRNCKR